MGNSASRNSDLSLSDYSPLSSPSGRSSLDELEDPGRGKAPQALPPSANPTSSDVVDLTSTVTLQIAPGWKENEIIKVKINETAKLVEVFAVVSAKTDAQSYFSTTKDYLARPVLGEGWTAFLIENEEDENTKEEKKKAINGGESPADLALIDEDKIELNCNLIIDPKSDIYPSPLPHSSLGSRKRCGFERLVYAVWYRQLERVTELLSSTRNRGEFDINFPYTHGPLLSAYICSNLNTPLVDWSKAMSDRLKLAEVFLRHPLIKINARDCYGRTAIQNAARDGNLELFTLLLDSGASLKGALQQIDEGGASSSGNGTQAGHTSNINSNRLAKVKKEMKRLILDRYAGETAEEDLLVYSIRGLKSQIERLRTALDKEQQEATTKIRELEMKLKHYLEQNSDVLSMVISSSTSRKRKSAREADVDVRDGAVAPTVTSAALSAGSHTSELPEKENLENSSQPHHNSHGPARHKRSRLVSSEALRPGGSCSD